MPIQVTCTGCKAQFFVSEKFAGKQGPCPKCKTVISIPKGPAKPGAPEAAAPAASSKPTAPSKPGSPSTPAAPAKSGKSPSPAAPAKPTSSPAAAPPPAPKAAEVKIHAPEEMQQSGKSKTGRPSAKPIFHRDVRLTWKFGLVVVTAIIVLFVAAWFGGRFVQTPPPLSTAEAGDAALISARGTQVLIVYALRTVGLLLIGWPIVVAGYAVLYDDELEPYRGRSLLLRTLICLAVYIGVWGFYALIPNDLATETYMWLFFAPALILPAAVTAYFSFDLDYVGGLIHACFFFLVTLLLGWTAGLPMPWQSPAEVVNVPVSADEPLEFARP